MIVFGIVSFVAQQTIKLQQMSRLAHHERKLRRILTGTDANVEGYDQMCLAMANNGEFGPMNSLMLSL